jgi:hypothetical protein
MAELGVELQQDTANHKEGFLSVSTLRVKNMGQTGFEPVTSRLSAGCSNQAKLQAH